MIRPGRAADAAGGRVDFARARALMLALAEPLPAEIVALDAAHGRIAAAALVAADDIVPYARSAMDGYAVRARDTEPAANAPVALRITGSVYAGFVADEVPSGCATAIATGAALPAGADAVVPIESVAVRAGTIVLEAAHLAGDYVFFAGDDAKRGDVLVQRGDAISPGRAALLAAAGHGALHVHRRPRVTVVCTGDEVVPVEVRPRPGQIRNSNGTMLRGLLGQDGAVVVSCVHAADTAGALREVLREALAASDLVITTGGASVGERDLVKAAFAELGTTFAFGSVALRPAKPTAFGRCGSALAAVLPGNPAAAFVGYALLVRGVVRSLAGRTDAFADVVDARLDGSIHRKPERHFAIFGRLTLAHGTFRVAPLDNQCSSLVRTSADANALIIVPPGDAHYQFGDTVPVEVLDWSDVASRGAASTEPKPRST